MAEKKLDFQLVPERLSAEGKLKIDINPAGKLPILSEVPMAQDPSYAAVTTEATTEVIMAEGGPSRGPNLSPTPAADIITGGAVAPMTAGRSQRLATNRVRRGSRGAGLGRRGGGQQDTPLHDGTVETVAINGALPIAVYLDLVYPAIPLMGASPFERSEVVRQFVWGDVKLFPEAIFPVMQEKILKRLDQSGPPDSRRLRQSQIAIHQHFMTLCYLLTNRACVAGDDLTAADFFIAAHLSLLDYMGAVDWPRYLPLQMWYARLKSRPSFRPLLEEVIAGVPPATHYASLDF